MNLGWLDLKQVERDRAAGKLKTREQQALELLELCWNERRPPLYAELRALGIGDEP
jgi:hypothetical protein